MGGDSGLQRDAGFLPLKAGKAARWAVLRHQDQPPPPGGAYSDKSPVVAIVHHGRIQNFC